MQHEIVAEHLTEDEACDFEIRLIKELNSNNFHFGYNITSGGKGGNGLIGEKNHNYGKKLTDEQKRKISITKKENPTVFTEEERHRRSERMKAQWRNREYREKHTGIHAPGYGRAGEKCNLYGKHGKDNPHSKPIICLDNNYVYESAIEAHNKTGFNHSKLCMCCRGERNSCGKDENGNPLHWKYYKDYLEENNLTDEEARKSLIFIDSKEE